MLSEREEIFDMLENGVDNIWGVCELSLRRLLGPARLNDH